MLPRWQKLVHICQSYCKNNSCTFVDRGIGYIQLRADSNVTDVDVCYHYSDRLRQIKIMLHRTSTLFPAIVPSRLDTVTTTTQFFCPFDKIRHCATVSAHSALKLIVHNHMTYTLYDRRYFYLGQDSGGIVIGCGCWYPTPLKVGHNPLAQEKLKLHMPPSSLIWMDQEHYALKFSYRPIFHKQNRSNLTTTVTNFTNK